MFLALLRSPQDIRVGNSAEFSKAAFNILAWLYRPPNERKIVENDFKYSSNFNKENGQELCLQSLTL